MLDAQKFKTTHLVALIECILSVSYFEITYGLWPCLVDAVRKIEVW